MIPTGNGLRQTLRVVHGCRRYNQWIYDRITPYIDGVVLDIGSGLGTITGYLAHPGIKELVLSDVELPQIEFPATKTPAYRTMALDIERPGLPADREGSWADTITCINVLEHIQDDTTALKHMKHLLKSGGKLVIFVPALPLIYGTLDRQLGHYRRYTKKSLRAKLEKAGFRVREAYYMNMLGVLTWFAAGKVLRHKQFHPKTCGMLDKTVPLLKALESIGPPLLGQSLIMIGEA